ncbi:hypothetical protein BH09BAC5_BH09BAC5_28380 [soil metagenome]
MKPFLIFVVDDDPLFLKMISEQLDSTRLLRKYEHNIESFTVGETCIEHLSDKPEVIILDYTLNTNFEEAANGMSILKKIKSHDPKIVVIMVSVQDNLSVANSLYEAGCDDYIMKNESVFSRTDKAVWNVFEKINMNKKIRQMNNRNRIFKILIFCLLGIILLLYGNTSVASNLIKVL